MTNAPSFVFIKSGRLIFLVRRIYFCFYCQR